uniref:Serine/threonine-protein phosphatase n=1 Tax=Moniliophthora roreri TaxID=221103 RepID=A0A0W0F0S8_MONRR
MSSTGSSSQSPSPVSTPPSSVVPSPQLSSLKLEVSHDFTTAIQLYTQAIEKNPNEPTIWCNRAYSRMKLEEFGYALADASTYRHSLQSVSPCLIPQAITLDPKYAKAYYRRATCHLQILQHQSAISDFKKVLALEPHNETVRNQMVSTQKLVRRIEFEKAIEMEEEKTAVERCREIILEGGCFVDPKYQGPHLPQEGEKYTITLQFIKDMIQWFKDGKTLTRRYVWEIVMGAYEHFIREDSLVDVKLEEGVTCDVIGDVHGQFYDLLHLYSLTGEPTEKHYLLMNGDLVDRGSWSVEVILTAFAYKWLYPKLMYINRGNHEAKDMNSTYGFEGEVKHKHGDQTYKLFAYVFTTLPLSTLIHASKQPKTKTSQTILSPQGMKRYFVVHGGLFSKDDVTLDDVRRIERAMPGRGPSKRGVGIAYGPDVTKKWCTANGVTGVIRSHEVRQNGYEVEHDGLCTTVFSAPNYVDQAGNKGAFIRINAEGEQKCFQFDASPHPQMKPMAYVQGGLGSLMM